MPTVPSLSFKLFGMPVQVRASFFLVSIVLAMGSKPEDALAWVVVSFACVLVHECGHAFTARAFGRTARIELHGMGGTAFHTGPPLSIAKECLVLLAGPGAGFVLGAFALVARPYVDDGVAHVVVGDVIWITLGYGVLNLIPIPPLDGGQLVSVALGRRFGAGGAAVASGISIVVGVGLVAAAVVAGSPRAAFLVVWLMMSRAKATLESLRGIMDRRHRAELDAFKAAHGKNDVATVAATAPPLLVKVKAAANVCYVAHASADALGKLGRIDEAAAMLARIPAGWTPAPLVRARILVGQGKLADALPLLRAAKEPEAGRQLISALTKLGQHDEAITLAHAASQAPPLGHINRHGLEAALFYAQRYEEAVEVSTALFLDEKCARSAYNACCTCCRLGRLDDAMTWFERAVNAKVVDFQASDVDGDSDLDPIRARPEFAALAARLANAPAPSARAPTTTSPLPN